MNKRHCRKKAYRHVFSIYSVIALTTLSVPAGYGSAPSNITAVWANDGGDKVTRDELRVSNHSENQTGLTLNRTWDGTTVNVFGAHNEVVSFNLVLEAGNGAAPNVSVTFDTLVGPNGVTIQGKPVTGTRVFDWTDRQIELFYARYLQICGLSTFGYNMSDERQVPVRMQRPHIDSGAGTGDGGWYDRPDHDKYYPDPLVPLELVRTFDIPQGQNQSIWVDIYIPKTVPAGVYNGTISISESGTVTQMIPVSLSVYGFELPDVSSAKAMAILSPNDIMNRYISAGEYRNWNTPDGSRAAQITDRYFQLFHRHKIALLGENECPIADHPCDSSLARLDGNLYTPDNGYTGPGVGTPLGVFSIGTYGTWSWQFQGEASMWQHADNWASWFQQELPGTDFFLYLQDEPQPSDFAKDETWAQWLRADPGPGKNLMSLVTTSPVIAQTQMPDVAIPVMHADLGSCPNGVGTCNNTEAGQLAANFYKNTSGYKYWAYNDGRPATGSSMTEDDGIAMRVLPWTQKKLGIDRWLYWYVNPDGQSDLFQNAVTFGSTSSRDASTGMTGYGYSNGNGLLVYPGTDLYNPGDSYGIDGPIASLRLKEWRRGLQDADYLTIASQIDPVATAAILQSVLPATLWEVPASDPSYYVGGGPSWSSDPDIWEAARAQLAQIISTGCLRLADQGNSMSACSASMSSDTGGQPPITQIELTISTSVPGAHFFIFGNGCSTGYYAAPKMIQVNAGTLCMITVAPPDGFRFSGWADQVTFNPRFIVMSQMETLVATFQIADPRKVPVTVTGSLPNTSVIVGGNTCPINGTYPLPSTWAWAPGSQCTFTAVVPSGFIFDQWSGGMTTNPIAITVPASGASYNVSFRPVSANPISTVTVNSQPAGATFYVIGSSCFPGLYSAPATIQIQPGNVCSLIVLSPSGLTFQGWSDGTTDNPKTIITTSQSVTYQANFQ